MDKENDHYKIKIGRASDDELYQYKACFDNNNSPKSIELLKWNHQENLPRTHAIYYGIANGTNEIAAIYTYLPVIFRCMGKSVTVMQSFDTLTDKKHRGKGLFIKLATAIENEQKQKEVEFVYGFPNEHSIHGFLKRLHFHYFGEVPFLIKPLRLSYFLNRFLKKESNDAIINLPFQIPSRFLAKYDLREIEHFGEDYEAFYTSIKNIIKVGIERNSSYMNWRYVSKPFESYGRYGLYENEKLKGIVVFALKQKHGGKIGYLMELLFTPTDSATGNVLLAFANKVLKKSKADLILAWCFKHSFPFNAFRKRGYYIFPERFRPQKLGVIVKLLNSKNSEDIYNVRNWFLSYSDSDTV